MSRQASQCQQAFSMPCLVNLISKDTHLVFSISLQASQCQQAFIKPCLVYLLSKDTYLVFSLFYCIVCSLQPCYQLLGKCRPLGSLVCDVSLCFCTFPYGVLGQVQYLIVSIPGIFLLLYFHGKLLRHIGIIKI